MVKGPEEWFLHAVNMRHDIKMAFRLWDAVRDLTCLFSPLPPFPSFPLSFFPSFPLSLFPSFPLSLFPSFPLSLFPSFPLSLVRRLSLSYPSKQSPPILTSRVVEKVIRAVSAAGEEIQEREHWKETDKWLAQRR